MKRFLVLLSAVVPLGMAACSQPQVVVEATMPQEGTAEAVRLADLPVRLLPYDRDAIFDSLQAAFEEPEPQIPAEITQAQEQVQQAQTEWRTAEERWNTVRDSLRVLAERTQSLASQGLRGTPQYRSAFEQFGRLEGEERQVKQRMEAAFARFDALQRQTLSRVDSIRVVREAWAERAFADYDQVVAARLQALDREELADTTGASGFATFRVPEGRWWVYARYTLPYQELYWNLPIEVTGDSTYVALTPETAEKRPVM
jgi:hypothetical protein